MSARFFASAHVAAMVAALALAAIVGVRPLWHDDLFFHLRTGEIVARTGSVPIVDTFTHTVTGAPWTSHEWGFGLLLYGFYRLGGYAGVVWLMPILLVCTFLAVYLQMRRVLAPERRGLAAGLIVLGLGAAQPSCLVLRAALITSLGIALVALLLQRLHASGRRRHVVALGFVFLAWANMHAGVAFGLFVVGMYWLQAAVDAWRAPTAGRWKSLLRDTPRDRALLVLGCSAVTLVNPSGFDLWTFPFRVNALFYGSGITWTMGQYRSPVPARYPFFFVLVALVLLACVPLGRLRRALRDSAWPSVAQTLGLAAFLVLALRSNRFILDFVVFALPFCAAAWGGTIGRAQADAAPTSSGRCRSWFEAAGLAVVLALGLALHPTLPTRVLADSVPVRLAEFIRHERVEGRMFNPEAFGGYLGWRLRQPVYWDGRNDIFGPVAIEWAHKQDFSEIVQRHALDVLIFGPSYHRGFNAYLMSHRGEWAMVYWDNLSVLYVKRIPKFQRLIERTEYVLLQPFGVPSKTEIGRLAADPALRQQAERELARALSQSDDTSAAWYLRGRIAQESGDARQAYAALRRAADLSERDEVLFHLARAAHDLGRPDEARKLLARAAELRGR